uniref:Uncharacterized protein n=1 Tax=Caenorhabditis japonica TaxID=281687 RepID=A0A8R1ET48_CAEJA
MSPKPSLKQPPFPLSQSLTAENGTGSADSVGMAIDMRRTNADARLPAVEDVADEVEVIAAFRRDVELDVPPPPPPIPPIDDDD